MERSEGKAQLLPLRPPFGVAAGVWFDPSVDHEAREMTGRFDDESR
jgi:hypothetical protein